MAWFKSNYEPGGTHHIRITDQDFTTAVGMVETDEGFYEEARAIAQNWEIAKYEAHDFPVAKIIGIFFAAYQQRQKRQGIPENLWIGIAELGRKETVEYDKYISRIMEKEDFKSQKRQDSWDRKGLGG